MKMLRRYPIPLVLVLVGFLWMAVLPARAATVTLRAPAVQADAGGFVNVPVEAVAAPSLGALHLELVYDPKILTPDSVARGALAGSNALVDYNAGSPGRLLIGLVTLDGIKGDGVVASVRFKVIGDAGTSSALTLDSSKAWESSSHAEVLVKTEAGKVTVGGGIPFLLLAGAAGVLALLLLLLIVFLLLRRRRPALQPAMAQPAYYQPPVATAPPPAYPAAPLMPPARPAPPPMTLPGRQGPPPPGLPESAPAATPQASDAFKKAEDQYFALKGRQAAGRLTHEQFEAAMKDLMIQDAQGRYWTLGVDDGKWYYHTGQTWVEGRPY